METFVYRAIGVIHSPFAGIENVPIQPASARGVGGAVEVFDEFVAGLKDLTGFSHIILIYHFHRVNKVRLTVTPFLDEAEHGVFATRAPTRPNPIGLSVVRLVGIEGGVLRIEDVDVVDGTPLLDIKPYVPEFDHPPVERIGWLAPARHEIASKRADGRFG